MQRSVRTALVGLAAVALSATHASAQVFGFSGTIFSWIAPTTSTYLITARGAQGGHGTTSGSVYVGGRGATVGASFSLTAGTVLSLAVGGTGSSYSD